MSRTARQLTNRQFTEFVAAGAVLIGCGVACAFIAMLTDQNGRSLAWATAGVATLAGITAMLRAWMLKRRATQQLVRPIESILNTVRTVEAGGLPPLTPVGGVAELDTISRGFNMFVAELQLERILADKARDTVESREATATHVALLHREAVHDSETDALTKLLNRRSLDRELPVECQQAFANETEFTFVMIDIDHFKKLNDTFGHQKGDEVLQLVGDTLLTSVRTTDGAYRNGGEEFALILRGAKSEFFPAILEKLRQRIEERSSAAGISVTASFGAAQFPRDANSAGELISKADEALYKAKENGRNQVVMSS